MAGAEGVSTEAMAMDCASAGSGIIMAIAFGVFCLILGFVLGTRARQMLEALKAVGAMLKRVPLTLQISTQAAGADGAETVDGDGEDEAEEPADILDPFLSHEQGMDIHPELVINPIMMYHIKAAKERLREEARLAALEEMKRALIEEGLSEAQADERVQLEADSGAGVIGGKLSALQTLIAAGARVTPMSSSENAEQIALNDLRRQKKNIEVYLTKQHDIDTTMTKPDERTRRVNAEGTKSVGAYERAMQTAKEPFGGAAAKRDLETVDLARLARARLVNAVSKNKALQQKLADFKAGAKPQRAPRSSKGRKAARDEKMGGAGLGLSADDLTDQLAAEDADSDGERTGRADGRDSPHGTEDDEDGEGDSGSEGYDDDDVAA